LENKGKKVGGFKLAQPQPQKKPEPVKEEKKIEESPPPKEVKSDEKKSKEGSSEKKPKEEKQPETKESPQSSAEQAKKKHAKGIRERLGLAQAHKPHTPPAGQILVEEPKENQEAEDNLEGGLLNKHPEEYAAEEDNEEQDMGEEEIIMAESGEGDGKQIRLQKVMIQDLNQEFLMDDQGNLYDLEGQFVGKIDNEAEEEDMEEGQDGGQEELPSIQPGGKKKFEEELELKKGRGKKPQFK
jgi:hypothetical protein